MAHSSIGFFMDGISLLYLPAGRALGSDVEESGGGLLVESRGRGNLPKAAGMSKTYARRAVTIHVPVPMKTPSGVA